MILLHSHDEVCSKMILDTYTFKNSMLQMKKSMKLIHRCTVVSFSNNNGPSLVSVSKLFENFSKIFCLKMAIILNRDISDS